MLKLHCILDWPRLASPLSHSGACDLLVHPTSPRHRTYPLEQGLSRLPRNISLVSRKITSHLLLLPLLPRLPASTHAVQPGRSNRSSVLRSNLFVFHNTRTITPTNPPCSPALGSRRLAISPSPTATVDLAPFQVPPETLPRPTVSSPYHTAVSLATRTRLHQHALAWQQVSISRHSSYLSQSSIVTYNSLGLP